MTFKVWSSHTLEILNKYLFLTWCPFEVSISIALTGNCLRYISTLECMYSSALIFTMYKSFNEHQSNSNVYRGFATVCNLTASFSYAMNQSTPLEVCKNLASGKMIVQSLLQITSLFSQFDKCPINVLLQYVSE